MSYYWFNIHKLLKKTKDKCHNGGRKERAAEYHIKNKNV